MSSELKENNKTAGSATRRRPIPIAMASGPHEYIPGDQELDLKALASAAGERKIQLVPVKELQALTGYVRGGVTALAAKRDFPVYVDETIELFDVISISAGVRGLQMLLAPADYLHATNGKLGAGSRAPIASAAVLD